MNKKNKIYGLIPIGGKGLRLSVPFSKEMIPQKNFDYYNPIVNHIVEKMELSGAQKIIFVHGLEFKKDVKEFFNKNSYIHIIQNEPNFAKVFLDFYKKIHPKDNDIILFGLPDSIFDKNPFIEMINYPGIICGLFATNNQSKVDRLNKKGNSFQIKTIKNNKNQDWFWGILKFDGINIKNMIEQKIFDQYNEIGSILNLYKKHMIYGEKYLDLGTWSNYNRYLLDASSFSNVEIEKKYDASNVNPKDFIRYFSNKAKIYEDITSKDFYYIIDNPNIEFIRYREKGKGNGSVADLTIKNFNKSQLNRFELTIPLADNVETHNIIHFLNIIGARFKFDITKRCHIFEFENYTIVYYSFIVNNKKFKIIEIELKKIDFNLISDLEKNMNKLKGFDPDKVIKKSKYQIINEQLNDSSS
jgi:glucose-1-phosphate thymidylyltransferase